MRICNCVKGHRHIIHIVRISSLDSNEIFSRINDSGKYIEFISLNAVEKWCIDLTFVSQIVWSDLAFKAND